MILMSESCDGFIEIDGYRIHYARWGEHGTNLVILHSMGMDAHSMDLLGEALSTDHRILALTILAHGDSSMPREFVPLPNHAELMRQAYVTLGFSPCVLIGHSIGGMMGMILAAEHPSEVKALVLVDIVPPDPSPRPWSSPPAQTFRSRQEALEHLRNRYPRFAPQYIENRLQYGFSYEVDGSLRTKPMGDARMVSYSTDLWPYVSRIRIPTLLIVGSESTLVTSEKQTRMKDRIPNLTTETIRGAGHMVPQEKPAEFEEAVKTFLSTVKA